jgi:acetoin utilization deacetylase AcuC-like enzyme
MLLGAADFAMLTDMLMEQTGGQLVMAHEGGYSEAHVPFCGHAVLQTMSGSAITAEDPLGTRIKGQQPEARFNQLQETLISEMANLHGLK